MSKIKIVTDSTMDMPLDMAEQLGIVVVPLSVTINGETYLDRVEIDAAEYMDMMKKQMNCQRALNPQLVPSLKCMTDSETKDTKCYRCT